MPVMKAALPARRRRRRPRCSRRLACRVPALERAAYTLDELLDEVVGPNRDLRAVEVHKRRERYTLGGCMAELTELRTDRRRDADDRGRVGGPGAR